LPFKPPSQVVCSVLNGLFERQPSLLVLLSAHAGRSFVLRAAPIETALSIGHDGRLAVSPAAAVPDVVLSIDTAQLWASGWRPGQSLSERAGIVHVSGDAAVAQTLSMLAKSWRPDVEDLLSPYVGDIAAVHLVAGVKQLTTFASQFVSRTTQNLAEYAAHEAGVIAANPSLQEQARELSNLNQQLDAATARVGLMRERLEAFGDGAGQSQAGQP
jgi:ubiquinone biosynthesis protein UbiJ